DRLPVHADVDFSPAFFEQTATGGEAEIDAVVLRQLLRLLWWLAYVPEDLVQKASGRRASQASARGLVPFVPRLSPLLRQPPILAGVCFAGRGTALPRVTEGIGRSWRIRAADQRIKSHVCQQSFRQGKANARPGLV